MSSGYLKHYRDPRRKQRALANHSWLATAAAAQGTRSQPWESPPTRSRPGFLTQSVNPGSLDE